MAYLTFYPGAKKWAGFWRSSETVLNYLIIVFGFYILIAGSYVSVNVGTVSSKTNLMLGFCQEHHP